MLVEHQQALINSPVHIESAAEAPRLTSSVNFDTRAASTQGGAFGDLH